MGTVTQAPTRRALAMVDLYLMREQRKANQRGDDEEATRLAMKRLAVMLELDTGDYA